MELFIALFNCRMPNLGFLLFVFFFLGFYWLVFMVSLNFK